MASGSRGERRLSLQEACNRLSISTATGHNWLRLGKLTPDGYDRGAPYFYPKALNALLGEIRRGEALQSRRNKLQATGRVLCRDYLEDEAENVAVVQALLARRIAYSPREMRLLLAECALQLLSQAYGTPRIGGKGLASSVRGEFRDAPWIGLVEDLLGQNAVEGVELLREERARISKVEYRRGQDLLGLLYLSLQGVGGRKASGAYYTPAGVAREMVYRLERPQAGPAPECGAGNFQEVARVLDPGCGTGNFQEVDRVLDPACGTGNFLVQLALRISDPRRLFGQDIDPLAVAMARANLAMTLRLESVDVLYETITCGDSLRRLPGKHFNLIVGNPPWGYAFSTQQRRELQRRYRACGKRSLESGDLFVECALRHLPEGGVMSFVLPRAVLHVDSHRPVREIILREALIREIVELPQVFDGVQCPAVALTLVRRSPGTPFSTVGVRVEDDIGRTIEICEERHISADRFNLAVTDREHRCLRKLEETPHAVTLEGRAEFALGIVTGKNRQYLLAERDEGSEPVLRGSDIRWFLADKPCRYLRFAPERFQQVAPEQLYRAPEKLLYRFVGGAPVFAYDSGGTLSLNSCNILIPKIAGLSVKYVLAVLNSRAVRFYCDRQFRAGKLLRSHIERIPIPPAAAAVQRRVEELVDRILSGGPAQPLYEQLDHIMMDLYGLEREEREMLHTALAGKKTYFPAHEQAIEPEKPIE